MSGIKSVFPIPKSKMRIPHSAFRFPHSYSLSILNRYFVGLLRWLFGQSYLQQTVLIGGRYYFRINGCRQKEYPFKAAVLYFSESIGGIAGAMPGETVSLYPDGFAADFNLQVIFVDARNLGHNPCFGLGVDRRRLDRPEEHQRPGREGLAVHEHSAAARRRARDHRTDPRRVRHRFAGHASTLPESLRRTGPSIATQRRRSRPLCRPG